MESRVVVAGGGVFVCLLAGIAFFAYDRPTVALLFLGLALVFFFGGLVARK